MSAFSDEDVEILKARLADETAKSARLEEELDLLSFENMQLRRQLEDLRERTQAPPRGDPPGEAVQAAEVRREADYSDLLLDGDGAFPRQPRQHFPDVCGGANVLASRYLAVEAGRDLMACGGVDKKLRVVDLASKNVLLEMPFAAPVLTIACHENKIACGMMDGSFAVVELDASEVRAGGPLSEQRSWVVKEHSKYVVDIRWSADGRFLATASHDMTVLLYGISSDMAADELPLRQILRRRFDAVPESVAFLPGAGGAGKLLVAVRASCHILVVDCETLQESSFSLNGNDWDTHVSFNALYLTCSPDQKSFSVSTDNSLHLIFRLENAKRLRTLSSHTCGDYGKPKVSWDCTGRYLVSNSEGDFGVHVYSLGSERIAFSGHAAVGGHKGQVRDIDCHATRRSFLSASFDHSVIEWGSEK